MTDQPGMTPEQRAELTALADRVEALTGGCEIADNEIANAVGWDWDNDIYSPGYTFSIDAAMTLAEPFTVAALGDIAANGLTGCCLVADTSTTPVVDYWGVPQRGPTDTRQSLYARAITAAALRAKAAS